MRTVHLGVVVFCAAGLACGVTATDPSDPGGGKADRGESSELLTPEEAQNVADALDDVCGDTFCCGDLNYYMASVSCDGASGACELQYDAQPYAEEDHFAADVLEGFPPELLARQGDEGNGPFYGRAIAAVPKEDGIWVRVSCRLEGDFNGYADLMEGDGHGGDDLNWKLYDHFLDCLHAMEDVLYATLPAGPPVVSRVVRDPADGQLIAIEAGETLDIELAGNATTGYQWQCTGYSKSFPLQKEWYTPSEPQLIGSGGTHTFRFVADQFAVGGEHQLTFAYLRPWEDEPIETLTVTVRVDDPASAD